MTRRPALFWCFILCLCHLPQAFPQNSADILLLYGNPQQFRYRYRDITVPGRFTGPVPVQHSRYSLNGAPAVSFYIQGTHSHTDGLTGYRLLNRHFTLEIPVSSPSLVPGANTVVLHIRDANNADHAFTLTFDWDPTPVPLPITLTDLSGFTSLQEIAQPVNGVWELDTAANVIRSTGGQYRDALLLLGSPHGSQEATYAVRFSGNNSFVGLSDFFAGHEDRVVPIGIKPGYSTAGLATVRGNGAAETWLAWGDLMKDHPDKWVRIHTGIPVPNAANLHDGRVYRVRHQMLFEDGVNSTRFKIWEDGQSEPAFWNSEVNDATVTKTNRFDTGIFSLFHSRATTEWFDIHVRSLDGPQMTLTVEAENGTVARLPSSESYPQGTMVTLSAVADNGHLFSHWTGDLTGSENPATLLMDAEKTVQAVFVPSPPYILHPLDLLAYWPFDESGGSTAEDISGNHHHGTLVNSPVWQQGLHGNALRFNGTNSHVNLHNLDIPGGALTLAAWVRAESFPTQQNRILSKATGTAESDYLWMLSTINAANNPRFRLRTGGSTATLIGSGSLTAGIWHHVAATYDGAHMRLYLDGELVGSLAKTGLLDQAPSVPAWIGGQPPTATQHPWHGLIDDVRIYTQALTQEEILHIMQTPGLPVPTPFEQWRMDNGVAEDTVVIHNQTYPAEHLFIMGAHRTSPDGPWQGLLRIESIIPEANGAHALNFQEQAGRRYRVWWTNDLRGIPEWHDMEHTEPEGPTLFFRLSVEHED